MPSKMCQKTKNQLQVSTGSDQATSAFLKGKIIS